MAAVEQRGGAGWCIPALRRVFGASPRRCRTGVSFGKAQTIRERAVAEGLEGWGERVVGAQLRIFLENMRFGS